MESRTYIPCSGLDAVRRGYESYARNLFNALHKDLPPNCEVILVKTDGETRPSEWRLLNPNRRGRLCFWLSYFRGSPYYWECIFFSLFFLIRMLSSERRTVTILTVDPTVAHALYHLRRLLRFRATLLFTHSVSMEPQHYVPYADRVQEVSIEQYNQSKANPIYAHKVRLLPFFGPHTPHQRISERIKAFRESVGIQTPYVALGVGVISKTQKRMDHLILSCKALPDDWSLLLCGAIENQSLITLGNNLLGERFVHQALPREEIPLAYMAADIFIHPAIVEGFGMVFLEAMGAGLPILAHRRELFKWIIGDDDQLVNMASPHELSQHLTAVCRDESLRRRQGLANAQRHNSVFSWPVLKAQYFDFLFRDC